MNLKRLCKLSLFLTVNSTVQRYQSATSKCKQNTSHGGDGHRVSNSWLGKVAQRNANISIVKWHFNRIVNKNKRKQKHREWELNPSEAKQTKQRQQVIFADNKKQLSHMFAMRWRRHPHEVQELSKSHMFDAFLTSTTLVCVLSSFFVVLFTLFLFDGFMAN